MIRINQPEEPGKRTFFNLGHHNSSDTHRQNRLRAAYITFRSLRPADMEESAALANVPIGLFRTSLIRCFVRRIPYRTADGSVEQTKRSYKLCYVGCRGQRRQDALTRLMDRSPVRSCTTATAEHSGQSRLYVR
ncbi:unnamed protein product, partial [Nesidiocoris tenuis]